MSGLRRISEFEKVTAAQYLADLNPKNKDMAKEEYNSIKLPKRATSGSAGYDFRIPFDVVIYPRTGMKIPTGIRCRIKEGWGLFVMPKSGLGFNYKVQLYNTIGLIDSDYYDSENEGHIIVKIFNDGEKTLTLKAGDKFVQGVFLPYGITESDNAKSVRNGGFGSTGR